MQQKQVRLPLPHPAVERVPGLAVTDAVVVGEGLEGKEGLGLAEEGERRSERDRDGRDDRRRRSEF
jgi:hypothetical protein